MIPKVGQKVKINPEWKKWWHENVFDQTFYGDGSVGNDFEGGDVLIISECFFAKGTYTCKWFYNDNEHMVCLEPITGNYEIIFGDSQCSFLIPAENIIKEYNKNKCSCNGPSTLIRIFHEDIEVCKRCKKEK